LILILTENQIQFLQEEEVIDRYNLNRPLRNLQLNDSRITLSIDSAVTTNKIFTDVIKNSEISSSKLLLDTNASILGNLFVLGSGVTYLTVSTLKTTDSVLEFNIGDIGTTISLGEGGLDVWRNPLDKAHIKFIENSKIWEASNSGVKILAESPLTYSYLGGPIIKAEYLNINIRDEDITTNPSSNSFRLYVKDEGDLYYNNILMKLRDGPSGSKLVLGVRHDIYDDKINNQSQFEAYFGNSSLLTGTTVKGWGIYNITGIRHVYQGNERLYINSGNYELKTVVHICNNAVLHGNKEGTLININDSHIGFIGRSITGVNYDGFTIYGTGMFTGWKFLSSLFSLSNVTNSRFKQKIKAVNASFLYNFYNDSRNIEIGDCERNNAVCFKNGEKIYYNNYIKDNVGVFDSCAGMFNCFLDDDSIILGNNTISGALYLGVGYMTIGNNFVILR
jgi:hypothetical protein